MHDLRGVIREQFQSAENIDARDNGRRYFDKTSLLGVNFQCIRLADDPGEAVDNCNWPVLLRVKPRDPGLLRQPIMSEYYWLQLNGIKSSSRLIFEVTQERLNLYSDDGENAVDLLQLEFDVTEILMERLQHAYVVEWGR